MDQSAFSFQSASIDNGFVFVNEWLGANGSAHCRSGQSEYMYLLHIPTMVKTPPRIASAVGTCCHKTNFWPRVGIRNAGSLGTHLVSNFR